MKKYVGALIILFFVGSFFVLSALDVGWLPAIVMWLGCAGVVALIWLAVSWLLEE